MVGLVIRGVMPKIVVIRGRRLIRLGIICIMMLLGRDRIIARRVVAGMDPETVFVCVVVAIRVANVFYGILR